MMYSPGSLNIADCELDVGQPQAALPATGGCCPVLLRQPPQLQGAEAHQAFPLSHRPELIDGVILSRESLHDLKSFRSSSSSSSSSSPLLPFVPSGWPLMMRVMMMVMMMIMRESVMRESVMKQQQTTNKRQKPSKTVKNRQKVSKT